ncbi:uncharacterized protein ACWYII_009363 [Salvelinus alpinus]
MTYQILYVKLTAGLLKALCILVMMVTLEAHSFRRMKSPRGCRVKELTTLTKTLINDSLTSYMAANGQNQPFALGFPDLDLNSTSPSPLERAQCGLHFIGKTLEKVLKDQESDLNPDHISMHNNLNDSVTMVWRLSACLKITIGGDCTQKPAHPEMPKPPFQRKRWSITLLEESRDFLVWVESVDYRIVNSGVVDSRIP